jgi:hypothetical protein
VGGSSSITRGKKILTAVSPIKKIAMAARGRTRIEYDLVKLKQEGGGGGDGCLVKRLNLGGTMVEIYSAFGGAGADLGRLWQWWV